MKWGSGISYILLVDESLFMLWYFGFPLISMVSFSIDNRYPKAPILPSFYLYCRWGYQGIDTFVYLLLGDSMVDRSAIAHCSGSLF